MKTTEQTMYYVQQVSPDLAHACLLNLMCSSLPLDDFVPTPPVVSGFLEPARSFLTEDFVRLVLAASAGAPHLPSHGPLLFLQLKRHHLGETFPASLPSTHPPS